MGSLRILQKWDSGLESPPAGQPEVQDLSQGLAEFCTHSQMLSASPPCKGTFGDYPGQTEITHSFPEVEEN